MKIQFAGAAGTVTGSKTLVTSGSSRLLVDCGLFQGFKPLRLRNWDPPPFPVRPLNAVVLTHAHIDHSGYLPLLVRQGFKGPVYCTPATAALCRILLPDAAKLQEEDAARANRKGYSRHHPALPLFSSADAEDALALLEPVGFEKDFEPVPDLRARFTYAGHILGAASVRMHDAHCSIIFSGDLGRGSDLLMRPPHVPQPSDHVVIESTYGDRLHDDGDPVEQLGTIVSRTIARGGTLVIPAFAVGRTQSLLFALCELKRLGRIPASLPVYLNSPMGADATSTYRQHHAEHRLSARQCGEMGKVAHIVNSVDASKALNLDREPKIIIAGSGMATGGRVVHHLAAFAPDPACTVLLAGFQAGGTRGAALLAGAREIKIHGRYVPVRAEIATLTNLSAHADQAELLSWLAACQPTPKTVFITHGEPAASDTLRMRINENLLTHAIVPEHLSRYELSASNARRLR
ncbi:MAG: MBL fold metallo-hydrolase [Alphaproteobacteria bacterium]|nr:MBL fold metallo-hydrolase [Alphaproteobacteria bacterium]